ncbi:alpha/beta hydrolase [Streptomyces sp. AJS327]|uniref:alpha/beta hydrolase n=1 Tax=Streptomyces sp. AJS327 TaxID=2545265 RepID=UPI0015DD7634|nr:alpha/beta hydrolase [Streptomyces sp. AJS327]MBA0053048.1 alpha/beta hydrolase [Streptomyces sp. AJS327]
MDSRCLFRVTGAALAATALLVPGCSAGSSDGSGGNSAASTNGRAGGTAAPLEALPEAVPEELKPYYAQRPRWRSCGLADFECATLKAPLDYDKPERGKDVSLAVARQRARDRTNRIGSLLVNPGGPGGSAIEFVQQQASQAYPPEVTERYDLVGVDPRGVARSEPVKCLTDERMDAHTAVDQTPDSREEVEKLVASYKSFAKGCERRSGDVLGHVSTVDSARDMDMVRAVLGDRRLNYVGASYGTFLGATYAGLFPQRSGRLVLDGAMDPSLSALQLNRDQTRGFETAFRAFAKDCVKRASCPLGTGDADSAGERMSELLRRIDERPLRTDTDRRLTESLATTGVVQSMYDEGAWPGLREALKSAREGDGTPLLELADQYNERGPDGSYGNIMYANSAVNCLDLPPAFSGPEDAEKAVASFEKASPVFGRGFAWAALSCTYWQREPTGEPHRVVAKGAPPMIVTGTTRDPATPYAWAEGLAGQLAPARLLTYDGDGHTAYLRAGDCVNRVIDTYLLRGTVPARDTTCD